MAIWDLFGALVPVGFGLWRDRRRKIWEQVEPNDMSSSDSWFLLTLGKGWCTNQSHSLKWQEESESFGEATWIETGLLARGIHEVGRNCPTVLSAWSLLTCGSYTVNSYRDNRLGCNCLSLNICEEWLHNSPWPLGRDFASPVLDWQQECISPYLPDWGWDREDKEPGALAGIYHGG